MTFYQERDKRYEDYVRKGYLEILAVARESHYPSVGNGSQYVDFMVSEDSAVRKVRILIDFRGEYFNSFFLDTMLPVSVTNPIRNMIHFTAREAYDYIIGRALKINQTN